MGLDYGHSQIGMYLVRGKVDKLTDYKKGISNIYF
jgi:hypothetical protein